MLTESNFKYLEKLAGIVSDIDYGRNHAPDTIPHLINEAKLIAEIIIIEGHNSGHLRAALAYMTIYPLQITDHIEATHAEIERLLGDQAHRVYLPEEQTA